MSQSEKVPSHQFAVDQRVKVASGAVYRIMAAYAAGYHPKLKGERGYRIVKQRNGRDFGPARLTRESNLTAAE